MPRGGSCQLRADIWPKMTRRFRYSTTNEPTPLLRFPKFVKKGGKRKEISANEPPLTNFCAVSYGRKKWTHK